MIGSGIGGIAGGFISESLGGSFELGAMIGNIAGGFIGSAAYDGIKFSGVAKKGIVIGKSGEYDNYAKLNGYKYYEGLPGYKTLEKISPKLASKIGWASNHRYIKNVMLFGGKIYNLGGSKTGAYAKELELIGKYCNLINL